jgi:hypothetical protein
MGQSTPNHEASTARDRLQKELEDENQRVKDACFSVMSIDPDTEPGRYEALVSAMIDALDRQVALDSEATDSQPAALQPDLFGGLEVESGALNALIAQIRSLGSGDEQSSDRYLVLSNYVRSRLSGGAEEATPGSVGSSINWEDLAERMDALRERLNRETQQDRSRSRQPSGGDRAAAPTASPTNHPRKGG